MLPIMTESGEREADLGRMGLKMKGIQMMERVEVEG
jgi:hypothetical protein